MANKGERNLAMRVELVIYEKVFNPIDSKMVEQENLVTPSYKESIIVDEHQQCRLCGHVKDVRFNLNSKLHTALLAAVKELQNG